MLALSHGNPKEKCELDNLRSWTYIQINKIWQNVTDVAWLMRTSKISRSDVELMKSFAIICDRIDKYIPAVVSEEAINSPWRYAIIDVEMRGINGMYSNFRRYQDDVRNELSRYSYSRAWQDFAETILQNSDTVASIPNAIDHIHKQIVESHESKQRTLFEVVLNVSTKNWVKFRHTCQLYK